MRQSINRCQIIMKTTFLILSIIIITSCVRPQLKPQAPIIPGDSILVSISNLLIDEIDTNTLNHYKIDLNHSSCIDSSIVPTIHYWGLDTSGKFTDQEKINILKFNSHKCDSLILDKSKLKTQRLLKIKSKFNEIYSINIYIKMYYSLKN